MKQFRDKKKRRDILYSFWSVFFLILLLFLLLKGVVNIYIKSRESSLLKKEAEIKLSDLEKRYSDLESDIAHLSTEEGIEEELRTKFGVVKPGEKVIVVVKDEVVSTTPPSLPVYKKIIDKIKGLF